ncbi:hypothetical protein D3C78_1694050 [compost metagenome]
MFATPVGQALAEQPLAVALVFVLGFQLVGVAVGLVALLGLALLVVEVTHAEVAVELQVLRQWSLPTQA